VLVGLAIRFALPIFAQQKETVDPKLPDFAGDHEAKNRLN
jgi:hypothetical protein